MTTTMHGKSAAVAALMMAGGNLVLSPTLAEPTFAGVAATPKPNLVFFLNLNRYAPKRLVIDQGGNNLPAGGMCKTNVDGFPPEHNRFLVELLEKRGGPRALTHLPGDLSILDNLLFFPKQGHAPPNTKFFPARDCFALPAPWDKVVTLRGKFNERTIKRDADGYFRGLTAGIYEMSQEQGTRSS